MLVLGFMYRTGDGGMFVFGDPFRRSRRHHNHRQVGPVGTLCKE